MQPAQLVSELQQENGSASAGDLCGMCGRCTTADTFRARCITAPGSTEQGISDLKKYAATLPKNSDVVLYCGCCPLEKCPNLRPAFTALKEFGFAKLRVLILPTSFNDRLGGKRLPGTKRKLKRIAFD